MPECSASVLADLSKCLCGLTHRQIELAKTYLLAVAAGQVPAASNLAELSKCLCGMTYRQMKMSQTFSLCQIVNGGGGGSGNLEGIESPLNVITPDFVGQVFVQSDGTIWQAGSLLSSSWTVMCDGANDEGLMWGPTPETVDEIDGSGGGLNDYLNTGLFPGSAFTETSFGNPVIVTNGVDFNGNTVGTLFELRRTQSVGGDFNISGAGASAWVEILLPAMQSFGAGFDFGGNPLLTTVDASSVINIEADLNFAGNNILPSLSFPSLTTINGGVIGDTCPFLVTWSAPNWLPTDGTSISFNGDALDAASVEQILRRCMVAAVATCAIDISGGTNTGLAALSAQGQQDAADLLTAGNALNLNA